MKTSNFSLNEIAHRPLPDDLMPMAVNAMGYMQAVRDAGCKHFGRNIALRITSGYRELEYNRRIGSSDRSYHIWRIGGTKAHAKDHSSEKGRLLWAVDFTPIGVSTSEYFRWYRLWSSGETYYHSRHNFIHTAPNAQDKPTWIQR